MRIGRGGSPLRRRYYATVGAHPLLYSPMEKLAKPMSNEELFCLPLEIQQAVANQRLEGLELTREVILDSLRQIRGEVSIEELLRKYKTR
jgi:Antitoxin VbhA